MTCFAAEISYPEHADRCLGHLFRNREEARHTGRLRPVSP